MTQLQDRARDPLHLLHRLLSAQTRRSDSGPSRTGHLQTASFRLPVVTTHRIRRYVVAARLATSPVVPYPAPFNRGMRRADVCQARDGRSYDLCTSASSRLLPQLRQAVLRGRQGRKQVRAWFGLVAAQLRVMPDVCATVSANRDGERAGGLFYVARARVTTRGLWAAIASS